MTLDIVYHLCAFQLPDEISLYCVADIVSVYCDKPTTPLFGELGHHFCDWRALWFLAPRMCPGIQMKFTMARLHFKPSVIHWDSFGLGSETFKKLLQV
jgi:hypothetical protein